MSFLSGLGSIGGGLIGGPAGAAVGGGIGGLLDGFLGGSSGSSTSSSPATDPRLAQYLNRFASTAAAANVPLTAAAQDLAVLTGALGGALGQRGSLINSGQLTQLAEAAGRAQQGTGLRAGEASGLANRGIGLLGNIADSRLSTELLNPQFTFAAGSDVLNRENELAGDTTRTNIGLEEETGKSKLAAARDQAFTMGDVFDNRGDVKGQMALGAQELNNALKLREATDLGSLARIQAEGKRQMALRRQGTNLALAGTRAFA